MYFPDHNRIKLEKNNKKVVNYLEINQHTST